MEEKESLTVDDLNRVFIRAQDEHGTWQSVNCREATDKQFDAWVKLRTGIYGGNALWTPEERADYCNQLWRQDALTIIKKDVEL